MAQYRTFFVPLTDDGEAQEALNAFLRSKRVLGVERVFAQTGWAFCVEWLEGGREAVRPPPKVDYREVLTPEQFAVFSRLRTRRKELADRDGVQVYAVMTNEQLAEMVRLGAATPEDLRKIEGVGDARIGKYGAELVAALAPGGDGEVPRAGGNEQVNPRAAGGASERRAGELGVLSRESTESIQSNHSIPSKRKENP